MSELGLFATDPGVLFDDASGRIEYTPDFVDPLEGVAVYATPLHDDHGIPKTPAPLGPRISLAFRVEPGRVPERTMYGAPEKPP